MSKYLAELLKENAQLREKVNDLFEDMKHSQRVQRQRCDDCFIMALYSFEIDSVIGKEI